MKGGRVGILGTRLRLKQKKAEKKTIKGRPKLDGLQTQRGEKSDALAVGGRAAMSKTKPAGGRYFRERPQTKKRFPSTGKPEKESLAPRRGSDKKGKKFRRVKGGERLEGIAGAKDNWKKTLTNNRNKQRDRPEKSQNLLGPKREGRKEQPDAQGRTKEKGGREGGMRLEPINKALQTRMAGKKNKKGKKAAAATTIISKAGREAFISVLPREPPRKPHAASRWRKRITNTTYLRTKTDDKQNHRKKKIKWAASGGAGEARTP